MKKISLDNIAKFNAWIDAAPPQLSRAFLQNIADTFTFGPSQVFRKLVQSMPEAESQEADRFDDPIMFGTVLIPQMIDLRNGLQRIAKDENRPEGAPDDRVHFEAWQRWLEEEECGWFEPILLSVMCVTCGSIGKKKLTPAQWAKALWVSQQHEGVKPPHEKMAAD